MSNIFKHSKVLCFLRSQTMLSIQILACLFSKFTPSASKLDIVNHFIQKFDRIWRNIGFFLQIAEFQNMSIKTGMKTVMYLKYTGYSDIFFWQLY